MAETAVRAGPPTENLAIEGHAHGMDLTAAYLSHCLPLSRDADLKKFRHFLVISMPKPKSPRLTHPPSKNTQLLRKHHHMRLPTRNLSNWLYILRKDYSRRLINPYNFVFDLLIDIRLIRALRLLSNKHIVFRIRATFLTILTAIRGFSFAASRL